MRLRAPAAMTAKENDMRLFLVIAGLVPAISMRNARPCHPKRDGRNRSGHDNSIHPLLRFATVLSAAVLLSACVQSKTPLLTATKPLLGDQFQLNRYEDFTDGKADSVKLSVFRWNGTRYAFVSGASDVKSFVAEPLDADTFLLEAGDDKVYAYLLARKLAEGDLRGRNAPAARHVRQGIDRQDHRLHHAGGGLGPDQLRASANQSGWMRNGRLAGANQVSKIFSASPDFSRSSST
jgi:hypothetical protein